MKKHLFRIPIYFMAFLLLFAVGCEKQGSVADTEADTAAIRAQVQIWCQAFESGDIETLLSLRTDDLVQLPPDAPLYRGQVRVILKHRLSHSAMWNWSTILAGGFMVPRWNQQKAKPAIMAHLLIMPLFLKLTIPTIIRSY